MNDIEELLQIVNHVLEENIMAKSPLKYDLWQTKATLLLAREQRRSADALEGIYKHGLDVTTKCP